MKLDRARQMDNQSAYLSDEGSAEERPDNQNSPSSPPQIDRPEDRPGETRLTANSFRSLMERLKKPVDPTPQKEALATVSPVQEKIATLPPVIESSLALVPINPKDETQEVAIAHSSGHETVHEFSATAHTIQVSGDQIPEAQSDSLIIASQAAADMSLSNVLMTEEMMSFPSLTEPEGGSVPGESVKRTPNEELTQTESREAESLQTSDTQPLPLQNSVAVVVNHDEHVQSSAIRDEIPKDEIPKDDRMPEHVREEESAPPQLAEWQESEQPLVVKSDEAVAEAEQLVPLPTPPRLKLVNPDNYDDHDIIEISKSIYATPTFAERSAFLVEIAAQAVAEARQEKKPSPAKLKAEQSENPFTSIALSGLNVAPQTTEKENSGELALSLLDMMLSGPNSGQPQERALAADALLKVIPQTPLKVMISITNRVALMKNPPPLLLTKLINDPRLEVAGPLLENSNYISDDILTRTIASGQVNLQRLIARRWQVSSALTDQLLTYGDVSVILTLIRNAGAVFSHQGFLQLVQFACEHHQLLAPLVTRTDLQAPIAFELFWFVPAELRRFILSRFLTDSETLSKILKITQVMHASDQTTDMRPPDSRDTDEFLTYLQLGDYHNAAAKLASIANIHLENAFRIVSDKSGEPLAIVMKALNMSRAHFERVVNELKASELGIIKKERQTSELQFVFDMMSLNKVRVLLTYWDWSALKTGPYALSH